MKTKIPDTLKPYSPLIKSVLRYLPIILLCLIAFSQLILTQTQAYLNPDKGGGFGLFSTVDKLNNRSLLLLGKTGNKEVRINIDRQDPLYKELHPLLLDARSNPTDSNLQALCDEVLKWNFSKKPESLRAIVRKCVFNSENASISYEVINEISVKLSQETRRATNTDAGPPTILRIKKKGLEL